MTQEFDQAMFSITVDETIAAAHRLPQHAGQCHHLHGHNWRIQVTAAARELDEQGMVLDFAVLKKNLRDVCALLDHKMINDIPPFDRLPPTAEHLAQWIWRQMTDRLTEPRVHIGGVKVWETDRNLCEFTPDQVGAEAKGGLNP
jgi:6-pyruvoyltetrahydropterin/6-carboxytetrahydropterin synthase